MTYWTNEGKRKQAVVLVLHVGYFNLEGIFPLEKALFLAEKLGSKESNMYLASYTSYHLSDIYYRSSECFFGLLSIDPHYEFLIKTQEIYHGTN